MNCIVSLLILITRIPSPSFVRARYCRVKIGKWTRHVHLCCEVPEILNEFESCSSRLFRLNRHTPRVALAAENV